MRNTKNAILFFLIGMLAACDYIPPSEQLIEIDGVTSQRIVLLTEFSGIGCVNCPTAQDMADELERGSDGQLIVVQMHPATNAFTFSADKEYDYTAKEADIYYSFFGGTATTPFPTGVIDFKEINNNNYFADYTTWGSYIRSRQQAKTQLSVSLQSITNGKAVAIIENSTDTDIDFQLIFWLVEDSISGRQLMPDGSVNDNYLHRHVFREALNGTWGTKQSILKQSSDNYRFDFSETDLKTKGYDLSHCRIVALAVSADMSELLAVGQAKITNNAQEEPFVLTINRIGAIRGDTTIIVNGTQIDAISGKEQMEVRGSISLAQHIEVDIEREEMGIEDQLCIGACVNGNMQTSQHFEFNISNAYSTWYAHYYPADHKPATITYRFYNSSRHLNLTIRYEP